VALDSIVSEIEEVANLVNNIAAASNEQDAGIAHINQGIIQVSEVVQENSATSEESAAASEELASQAYLLKELVDEFKLKQNTEFHNKYEEVNPEVLKMLDDMPQRVNTATLDKKDTVEEVATNKRIMLSDSEFGKY
jgi:methyl-accepting chemotaxis protein